LKGTWIGNKNTDEAHKNTQTHFPVRRRYLWENWKERPDEVQKPDYAVPES
jgi:hypothetical protein